MNSTLLRLFSRKKIPECNDFGDLSRFALGIEPSPAPDVDNLLRGLSGARENGTRETHFLEFKAHYMPKEGDASSPAACKWNVVEAMISMANAWGGCILLGVGEDKTKKELFLVDIGYDAFIKADQKHEDRHFCDHIRKELLGSKGGERLVFEVADTQRYELDKEYIDRLRNHVSFHICHSARLNGHVLAILVTHVRQMADLIPVTYVQKVTKEYGQGETQIRETQKDLLFHRDQQAPDTVRKEWKDVGAYYSNREAAKPDFSKVAENLLFRIDGRRVHRFTQHVEEVYLLLLLILAVLTGIRLAIAPETGSYLTNYFLAIVVVLIGLSVLGYFLGHRLAPLNSLLLDATVTLDNKRELDVEVWRIVTENKNAKSKWRYCYEVHLRWADSLEDAPFRVQQFFVYYEVDRGLRRGNVTIETLDLNRDGHDDLAIVWRGSTKNESGKIAFWAKAVFLYDPQTQDLDLSSPVCEVSQEVLDFYGTLSDIPKKEFLLGYFPVGNRMVPFVKAMQNASDFASADPTASGSNP